MRGRSRATRATTILVTALALAALGAPAAALGASTIFVTTMSDNESNDGFCSLREAIKSANTDTGLGGCVAGAGVRHDHRERGRHRPAHQQPARGHDQHVDHRQQPARHRRHGRLAADQERRHADALRHHDPQRPRDVPGSRDVRGCDRQRRHVPRRQPHALRQRRRLRRRRLQQRHLVHADPQHGQRQRGGPTAAGSISSRPARSRTSRSRATRPRAAVAPSTRSPTRSPSTSRSSATRLPPAVASTRLAASCP